MSETEIVRTGAEVKEERWYTAGFEARGNRHEPRNAAHLHKVEKEMDFPIEPPEGMQPGKPLLDFWPPEL